MKSKLRMDIISREEFPQEAMSSLAKSFTLTHIQNVAQLNLSDATHVWVDLNVKIDEGFLTYYPNLRSVICRATATTNVESKSLRKHGIEIISLLEHKLFLSKVPSTAELAWTLLMISNLPISEVMFQRENRLWDRSRAIRNELQGKKIGIIGLGRIGSMIAKYAGAFGLEISYAELPQVKKLSSYERKVVSQLCATSDYLVITASIRENSEAILTQEILAQSKEGIRIINVSRGRLVDEASLYSHLVAGKVAFYAADCAKFEEIDSREEDVTNYRKLVSLKNVLFTPHIGGYTREAIANTTSHLVDFLLKGECECQISPTEK